MGADRVLLAGVVLALLAACVAGINCPDGFTLIESAGGMRNKCLHISEGAFTFTQCQTEVCGPKGGTLACISDATENDNLAKLLTSAQDKDGSKWSVWIGLHEGEEEGKWAWTSSTCDSKFTSWMEGEPNDYCVDEDCAMMAPSLWGHQWVDAACQMAAHCVCEAGTTISAAYTQDVVQSLKENIADYESCKEEDEGRKELKNTWKRSSRGQNFMIFLILAVSTGTLAVTVQMYRRIGGFRNLSLEQPLGGYPNYNTLPDETGQAQL